MQFLTVSLLLASGVWALPSMREEWKRQNATDPATGAKIIPVAVGGAQDVFVPSQVTAAAGDIIQFQFSNGNHTVTQSAEDQACVPLQQTNAAAIHSGHIPFADGQQEVGTFNMVVQNTDTMFLYCATGPHCQEGQVMVINPQVAPFPFTSPR
jgi:plastocyanin